MLVMETQARSDQYRKLWKGGLNGAMAQWRNGAMAQWRMGTALLTYKNKKRGSLLPDGKGTGGAGRLTNVVVDTIQTYYGYAIRNNKGNRAKIRRAIWPIFYHMFDGPKSEPLNVQHNYCPKAPDTWCKFEKDVNEGTNTYSKQACLPYLSRRAEAHIWTFIVSWLISWM